MLAGSEKCNFNATEMNQEIIAKEKVQKAKPVRKQLQYYTQWI